MRTKLVSAILSLVLTAVLLFIAIFPLPDMALLSAFISLAVFACVIYLGRGVFVSAIKPLRPGEELFAALISIFAAALSVADIIRLILGDTHKAGLLLPPAAAAMSLVLFSEYFSESIVPEKPASFGEILPETATALCDGIETEVATYELSEGDVVSVKPGEIIPCDGMILAGRSDIDERIISGGLLPQLKGEGDEVYAGTRSLSGFLTLRSSGTRAETDGMRRIFSEMSAPAKPEIKGVVRLLPLIAPLVSIIVFVIVYLLRGFGSAAVSFTAALTLLAPCGVGLCGAVAARHVASKSEANGLRFRDLWALDKIAQIRNIVLTRSGTATVGKLTVSEVIPLGEMSKDSVIRLAAALSDGVDGADFSAIASHCRLSDIAIPPCIGLERLPGQLNGLVDGVRTVLSAEPNDVEPYFEEYPQLCAGEKAVRAVFFGGEEVGLIALSDKIKPSAPAAIKTLSELGARPALISGGIEEFVSADADALGVLNHAAGLGPMEKERFIRGAKSSGITAAVGDGFCDVAAIVSADCSFAMASGAEEAKAAATAVLLRNDLRDIVAAIDLAKAYKIAGRVGRLSMLAVRILALVVGAILSAVLSPTVGSITLTCGLLISAFAPPIAGKVIK